MSTHNIGFCEDLTKNYLSIIIEFHQMRTLSLLLNDNDPSSLCAQINQKR